MKKSYLLLSFILFFIGSGLRAQTDNPRLIDIDNLEKLNAIRYDLDGDGVPTTAGLVAYNTAFGTGITVGDTDDGDADEPTASPSNIGYELMNDLDFNDADGDGAGTLLSRWAKGAGAADAAAVDGTAVVGGWVPIGDNSSSFTAIFEGNGYTISNLYINTSIRGPIGFFGSLGSGEIRNLGIEGGSVTANGYSVGVLVGIANNNSTISACYVTGSASGGDSGHIGGLAGSSRGTISACYVTGSVTGGVSASVGGLAGGSGGTITASYATGDVSGDASNTLGGLVGSNQGKGTITASYATGAVTGGDGKTVGGLVGFNRGAITTSYATGDVLGGHSNANLGGLVGAGNAGTISACYATGAVTGGDSANLGGLMGASEGITITASYATGAVTGGESANLGGLVGADDSTMISGTISACYATGAVTGGDSANVGGLVGADDSGTISAYCYATGSVTGGSGADVGGLVGENSGTIRDSYFDKTTAIFSVGRSAPPEKRGIGNEISSTAIGKITSDLQSPTAYGTGTGGSLYENWNVDIDDEDSDANLTTGKDDPWDFGTRRQYPVLQVDFDGDGRPSADEFGGQDRVDPSPSPSPPPDDGDDGSSLVAITSMSPNSGPVGAEVTLRGRGFSRIATRNRVIFNGVADLSTDDVLVRSLTPISETEMTIRVPEGALSGRIRLIVEGERATSSEDFTVKSDGSASDVAVFRVPDLGNGKPGVYPNPASDRVYVSGLESSRHYTYELYSFLGQKVGAGQLSEDHEIDLRDFSVGTYVLVLRSKGGEELLRNRCLISK